MSTTGLQRADQIFSILSQMPSTTGPHSAFFYGTLMAPRVLSRVCFGPNLPGSTTSRMSSLTFAPALLPGFRRHRVKHADYPGIIPNEDAEVRGTYVSGLLDGDIYRLDMFEGNEYRRQKVKIQVLKEPARKAIVGKDGEVPPPAADIVEKEVECETYVYIAGENYLEAEEWDFDEFVKEKMWRWVGKDAETEGEYEDVDRAVALEAQEHTEANSQSDPTRGRGLNGSISKALEERAK